MGWYPTLIEQESPANWCILPTRVVWRRGSAMLLHGTKRLAEKLPHDHFSN